MSSVLLIVQVNALNYRALFMSGSDFADLKSLSLLNIEVGIGASSCLNMFSTVIAAFVNCNTITLE